MKTLGLDIGGANLKAADGLGLAVQSPFALWKDPGRLTDELRTLIRPFEPFDRVAVTMTGELCDCFPNKTEGVLRIVDSVRRAVDCPSVDIWTTSGEFIDLVSLMADPLRAAAANWLALATFGCRYLPTGRGLVLDLGSTTCDIIPIDGGRPVPVGRTDPARMTSNELVYCGVRRTPLCALFGLTRAAELFATTEDVYLTLGDLPEEPGRTDTADGRAATVELAHARLARMECDEQWSPQRAFAFAAEAREIQVQCLAAAVRVVAGRLPGAVDGIVVAGAGEFLASRILKAAGLGSVTRVSLAEQLGPLLSTAACAHAVAVLAGESR